MVGYYIRASDLCWSVARPTYHYVYYERTGREFSLPWRRRVCQGRNPTFAEAADQSVSSGPTDAVTAR